MLQHIVSSLPFATHLLLTGRATLQCICCMSHSHRPCVLVGSAHGHMLVSGNGCIASHPKASVNNLLHYGAGEVVLCLGPASWLVAVWH